MAQPIGLVPRRWWAFGLRGLAAIIFGILALIWPGVTLTTLILLFGTFTLVNGVLAIISAFRSGGDHVWLIGLSGVLNIVTGIAVFAWPGLTALLLLFFLAVWAIVTGAVEVFWAVPLRNAVQYPWLWFIGGVLSIVFGLIVIAEPAQSALALMWLIGIYAILYGVSLLALAWRIYDLEHAGRGHRGGAGLEQPIAP